MNSINDKDVLRFIRILRNSNNHPGSFDGSMVDIFTGGSCYKLYLLLSYAFPTSEAYFSDIHRNHIVTKIGDYFYDINGKVKNRYLHADYENGLKLDNIDHKECRRWTY